MKRRLCGIVLGLSAMSFTGCSAGPLLFGFVSGVGFGDYYATPRKVFVADVNGDGKEDVIIKNGYGVMIYLYQKDGPYKRAKNIKSKRIKQIVGEARELKGNEVEKYKHIMDRAEEIVK